MGHSLPHKISHLYCSDFEQHKIYILSLEKSFSDPETTSSAYRYLLIAFLALSRIYNQTVTCVLIYTSPTPSSGPRPQLAHLLAAKLAWWYDPGHHSSDASQAELDTHLFTLTTGQGSTRGAQGGRWGPHSSPPTAAFLYDQAHFSCQDDDPLPTCWPLAQGTPKGQVAATT